MTDRQVHVSHGSPKVAPTVAAVDGLPIGLPIVGGRGSDATLAAVAAAFTTA